MRRLEKAFILIVSALALLATSAWLAGRLPAESLCLLAIGMLLLSAFYFVLALLVRLPFQRLRAALASLGAIALVMLGLLYVLPLIDAYRQGYDVSRSLFHPMVFASLGLAIVLLTPRNHHRY